MLLLIQNIIIATNVSQLASFSLAGGSEVKLR